MMQLKGSDAIHRSTMYAILMAIADDPVLSHGLIFKGGTCAVMLGWLDRFSVDLDFDLMQGYEKVEIQKKLERIFSQLSLPIAQKHPYVMMYTIHYSDDKTTRKTIKLSVNDELVASSRYNAQYLPDIDRTMICQTRESMVAHKLVALIERYTKKGEIAGRDVFDIHHYLLSGFAFSSEIIVERTGVTVQKYLAQMKLFMKTNVTQRTIDEDLNVLLPTPYFKRVRLIMIPETIALLGAELSRMQK